VPGIAAQYRIIAGSAGWRRRSERGRLRFSGGDRTAFLQALLTNDVAALASGQGAYSAYLTPQGRMIADLHVFARVNHVLADVPAADAAALASAFDRLIFAEDVSVKDVSAELAQLTVTGGKAPEVLAQAFGLDADALRGLSLWSHQDFSLGFVTKTDDAKLPSYDVVVPSEQAPGLIESLSIAGAIPMTEELSTALRVDAGRPLFGTDMDTDTIPLEAGLLERAISTTKGCYVGQEVIIRVLHRGGGRVARRLVKITFPSAQSIGPQRGALLREGDREIGNITSAAAALENSGTVALAYVRRDAAEIGHEVVTDAPQPVGGVITDLLG
jgi:folate-binding protein YgfZ